MFEELDKVGTEIRCKKCSKSLAKFVEIPTGIVWYSQLRHKLRGECPECGHKLSNVSNYVTKMHFEIRTKMSNVVN